MKIAIILGSPSQESNSAKIANKAAEALPGKDKEIRKFEINSISAKGCQACYSCKGRTETCVVLDDILKALSACQAADWVILASPVYIGDVTGQLKLFVDRTFSWYVPDF
jgi:multimeric flavodoxin WrbA